MPFKVIRHKFNAKRTELDGINFASKKEAKRYQELKNLQKEGGILFFLRQVPFHIQHNVKYICDFQVFWVDGTVTFEDVKGIRTDLYEVKKKLVEANFPIEIKEI